MQLRIDDCIIDTESRQVIRCGHRVPLSPKAFQLLAVLADARPRALSKDELHRILWPNTHVVDANLSNLVGEIRAALHDSSREPKFIRTLHGYGYAFSGDQAPDERLRERAATSYWLSFGDEQLPLRAGENIVGRAIDADVRLDVVGVSRRHACILIIDGEVFVEDAGSKNGTFVKGQRITSRQRLAPDEEVVFASTRVTLRVESPSEPTETI